MKDLVSIITPTFNSANYVLATINSVLNQTYTNWELLLVDDCSTDDTYRIIQEQASLDPRIKVFQLENNAGPAKARNFAINKAQGSFMTFLDADDIWFADFIQNSIETIEQTGINFVFSSYKRANENLEFVYSDFIVPAKVTYTDILKTNSISCLTAFINIKALGKKTMPDIRKRQDMGLWLKYLKEIPFAYGITTPKAIYRIRKNSLSRNKLSLIKYQWEFYRKVEQINILSSTYYLLSWMYLGYMKYRN